MALFFPPLPEQSAAGELHELAAQVITESKLLSSSASEALQASLEYQLLIMNSYYTNRIEGEHTRPIDIENALLGQLKGDEELRRKARLAISHIEAEKELNHYTEDFTVKELFSRNLVTLIHRTLYLNLLKTDCVTEEGKIIEPGLLREDNVAVGHHVPPDYKQLPDLLKSWEWSYSGLPVGERALIGLACSHHRLVWIHPFLDGNGRMARLHSHVALSCMNLTNGLWSPMRGLARNRREYFRLLNDADLPRRNDHDGRGPLSQEGLIDFARFFLETCHDQIQFMSAMLSLKKLKENIKDLLVWLSQHPEELKKSEPTMKVEALEALHYTAITGPQERKRFIAMTGLGERTGRRVLSNLLHFGVLKSPSSRGPVSFAVPLKSLRFLFPKLWPEAETDF